MISKLLGFVFVAIVTMITSLFFCLLSTEKELLTTLEKCIGIIGHSLRDAQR